MEDKLRYVLSVRTLIEMSLIRASRIATTATVDELMRAVIGMRERGTGNGEQAGKPTPKWAGGGLPPMPEAEKPASAAGPADRTAMLDDPKLNEILGSIPGATVSDIR